MSYSANFDKKFISPICLTYLSNKCSENRRVYCLKSRILPWKCFGAIRDWFRPCTHLSFSFSFVPRAYETMHINLREIKHGLSLPMKTFRTGAIFWDWFHKFTKTRTSLILRQAVTSVISITCQYNSGWCFLVECHIWDFGLFKNSPPYRHCHFATASTVVHLVLMIWNFRGIRFRADIVESLHPSTKFLREPAFCMKRSI